MSDIQSREKEEESEQKLAVRMLKEEFGEGMSDQQAERIFNVMKKINEVLANENNVNEKKQTD